MCYGDEAQPPDHGIHGEVRSEEDLVLVASDGTRFSARLARPAQPGGVGVVILPDVRGLYSFYCAMALSFAEAGVEAIAIDHFGRTAGLSAGRSADFDWQSHVQRIDLGNVTLDVRAALDKLRSLGTTERVFTVGFCMGGALSWRQSAEQQGLAGAIGFYGVPSRTRDTIPAMKAPLLLLLAGADRTPAAEFATFQRELTDAGVQHRAVTYEGAPHSFFDRGYEQWADACQDSWRQIFTFMGVPQADGGDYQ
jgi:carboxymethylenebutenolidase